MYLAMTDEMTIIISFIVAFALMIPITYSYFKYFRLKKEQRKKRRKELTDHLMIAFENKAIKNIKDLIDFINGYENINELSFDFPSEYHNLLSTTKHSISIKSYENVSQENLLSDLNSILKEVDNLIIENNRKEPFHNVPTSERNLLIDILEISGKKENTLFNEKLQKLGELIRAKEDTFKKLGNENNESLRVSKQSRNLAIVFFFISLALTIYSLIK